MVLIFFIASSMIFCGREVVEVGEGMGKVSVRGVGGEGGSMCVVMWVVIG